MTQEESNSNISFISSDTDDPVIKMHPNIRKLLPGATTEFADSWGNLMIKLMKNC